MDLVLVVKLLNEQPCSSPFIQGAGPAQPLAWHFLWLTCQDSLERMMVSVNPTTIFWRWEKLSFSESCDSFVLQTLDHTKSNQVQIHLMEVKLVYKGTVRESICCAKGTVSVWLVILERNQLLPVIPTSSSFCSASIRTNVLPER